MKYFLVIILVGFNLYLLHANGVYAVASKGYSPIRSTQQYTTTQANYRNKEIVISLREEKLITYDGAIVVLQTPVTTGGPDTPTPVGVYHVVAKYQNFVMHSPWPPSDWRWYPDSFVNFGLLFRNGGYFIHDAPWRSNFGVGSDMIGGTPGGNYTGTHGCVNVPLTAEAQLYDWTTVGTTVIVQY